MGLFVLRYIATRK